MPELPEVETVRRGLEPVMEGARVEKLELRRKDLRFPFPDNFQQAIEGQSIISLGRRAKYLLVDVASGAVIIMHLGMSGSFRIEDDGAPAGLQPNTQSGTQPSTQPGEFHHERSRIEAHDHVTFHLKKADGGVARVIYNDPRRFGFMLLTTRSQLEDHPTFKDMGVEPVGNALDEAELASKLKDKAAPLKAALLDQRVVAGLGNIYVCEALWRSGLSPKRKSKTLVRKNGEPTQRVKLLVQNIKDVITDAIDAGGSSLRDHAQTDGTLGYFQHSFAAYDREGEPCRKDTCDGTITRIVQSGRSTFYCPTCQR